MEIRQADISSDLNFRTKMKEYEGIKAFKSGNEWYWKIEISKIDWNILETDLTPNYSKELNKLKQALLDITALPLKDIFNDISRTVSISSKYYKVEGDIHRAFSTGKNNIYTLIDNQNLKQTIQIVTPIGTQPFSKFLDKRVIICGRLDIYSPSATFQLQTDESKIDILGDCSRIIKYKEWAETLKDIIKNKPYVPYKPFSCVGIIGQKESRGYTDFIEHLKKSIKDNTQFKEKLTEKYIALDTQIILKYLAEFNEETKNPCDYICIVRGGDDPESMLQYSEPNFVRAIARSKIPVITGIGHDKDNVLCDKVAAFGSGTPTGAAEKLNAIEGAGKKRNREQCYQKRIETIVHEAKNDKQRIAQLEQECQRLNKRISDLEDIKEQLQQQLEASKNKGFFARLFGK